MLCFFCEAIRITEKVGHSLACFVLVNKHKYFRMPFGVLFVCRTHIVFPQFMNQSETISPQMLELPKALMLRSFCFQNDNVSTKVRLFFSNTTFSFYKKPKETLSATLKVSKSMKQISRFSFIHGHPCMTGEMIIVSKIHRK